MKTILGVFTLWALSSAGWADGFLYIAKPGEQGSQAMERGNLVLRIPVAKIEVTDVVLRHDTDDPSILWLEFHMEQYRDPGDHIFYFKPAQRQHSQFFVRGSHIHEEGCKWAIKFDKLPKARMALSEAAKSYKLNHKRALDQTKGEQDGAGQPATRSESK